MKNKGITIRLKLDNAGLRLIVITVLLLGLTGSVAWAREGAGPPTAPLLQGGSGRSYYLTETMHTGKYADEACASGYHMASLWEILDTSNLAYDTTLGYQPTPGDAGEGPPTGIDKGGWIRTGYVGSVGYSDPGKHNCAAWTYEIAGTWGTYVYLPADWSAPGSTMGVWAVANAECDTSQRVWCVGD